MRNAILMTVVATMFAASSTPLPAEEIWPQWRGSEQNGVAPNGDYPTEWNEDSVAWSVEIPGSGGSTPVIDHSSAYLTSGIDGRNTLIAVDLKDGTFRWQVTLGEERSGKHRKGSGSNPSAVIDGDRVFAYFKSGDLACVDTSGEIRWQTNLQERFGEDSLWWDLGSSPTVTDSAVIVAVMQTGPSYLAAFDKDSGDLLWKQDRMLGAPEEAAQSYITPLVVEVDGRSIIAVMGADHLTLHAAEDGKELGRLGGFNPMNDHYYRSIASPVAAGSVIVCPYGRGSTVTAVNMSDLIEGKGRQAIMWHRDDLGSDVPTPAANDGKVYIVADKGKPAGLVQGVDLMSGESRWQVQLPKSRIDYSSSPLIAGNRLYVTSEDATTYVIGPLDELQPELLAVNRLADSDPHTVASPVPIGEGSLLLRTRHRLYRVDGE